MEYAKPFYEIHFPISTPPEEIDTVVSKCRSILGEGWAIIALSAEGFVFETKVHIPNYPTECSKPEYFTPKH